MKRIIIIGLVFLCLLTMVSAEQIFEKDTKVDLKVPCINNATYCSVTSACNITIFYPNHTVLFDNEGMTNAGAYYNITINETYTSQMGTYPYDVLCIDGNYPGYGTFAFQITPNGYPLVGDNFLIFLYLAFIITTVGLIYLFVMNIAKFATLSMTIFDVAFSWGFYFAMFVILWILKTRSIDTFMNDTFGIYISITGFAFVILPLIALLITVFYKGSQKYGAGK